MTLRGLWMTLVCVQASVSFGVPAFAALKVTNMSYEPKTVLFESAGSVTEHTIAPRSNTYISGIDGFLTLKGSVPTPIDHSMVGTRSAVFGLANGARTQRVPASQMDEFVIWPDGRLMFQKRQTGGRNAR